MGVEPGLLVEAAFSRSDMGSRTLEGKPRRMEMGTGALAVTLSL
jgi:hypothetical protein